MEINSVEIRKIISSTAETTVEADINGSKARAPSGYGDGGRHMPDHLEATKKDLKRLEGRSFDQEEFDRALKSEVDREDFSGSDPVITAASLAFKNLSGYNYSKTFPVPLTGIIGGGRHGGNSSIEEFLVMPVRAETFPEAVRTNAKIYREFKDRYRRKIRGRNQKGALITSMGDEETLKALEKVAEKYEARIGVNMDGSNLYNGERYNIPSTGIEGSPEQHFKFVQSMIDRFELVYVEDPFHEEDFYNHSKLHRKNPEIMVCGKNLFSSRIKGFEEGVENGACNSLGLNILEAGTVTEIQGLLETADRRNYTSVISSGLGETCDASVSKLALEFEVPVIKTGITDVGTAKLNRLLELWKRIEGPKLN